MSILPVIVGYGGVSPAGRSSFDQAYRRMVLESLCPEEQQHTVAGLACMMKLVKWCEDGYRSSDGELLNLTQVGERYRQEVCKGTLVRGIEEASHYNPDAVPWQVALQVAPANGAVVFEAAAKDLPQPLPSGWRVEEAGDGKVRVEASGPQSVLMHSTRNMGVKAAGQLPTGFDPGSLYSSRFLSHP